MSGGNDTDMEGYVMCRLSDESDTKQLWGIRHNEGCEGSVVRSGLGDALYWIEVHEDVCPKRVAK